MVVKSCLQIKFNHFVCGFYLTVSLQMHKQREIAFYFKLYMQLLIFLIVRLIPIASYNLIGYAKFVYDVPLDEIAGLGLYDSCERFYLYPLS